MDKERKIQTLKGFHVPAADPITSAIRESANGQRIVALSIIPNVDEDGRRGTAVFLVVENW
jgi:hypothetical protein